MKKLFYKLFSKAERALMMKDLSALCRRRLILTLLIALPLVFAVAFPLLFLFVSAMVSPESSGVEQFKNLLDNIPQGTDERAQMFYIFTAFISPMLFMLIPLLSAIHYGFVHVCGRAGTRHNGNASVCAVQRAPLFAGEGGKQCFGFRACHGSFVYSVLCRHGYRRYGFKSAVFL